MEIKTIEEINQYIGSTVKPLDNPDRVYELYSVPSFESQHPEIIKGADIGSSKITVEEGDVLVCKINPRINRVWVVKRHTSYPLLASSEWIVIRNCDIDSDYLKWYFSSPTFRNLLVSQVAGIGGSLTRAQPKRVAKYPVPLVEKEEQRRIAALLDKVSDLIAKRRAQLDKLDELVKARFVEMFGDPVSNSKGWDKGTIRDVVSEVKYGTSKPAIDGGAYKYLRMGNITFDGRLDLSDLKYIDIPDSELEKYMVRKGDVLFNRTNSKELVGKTCVFDLNEPMVIAGYIIRVRVNSKVLPIYLSAVLNSQYGKQTLADMCKAIVGQANINAQELQDIAILIPPIELQEKFSDYAETIKKSKLTIQQSLDKLEVLRKALMQQYFG